MTRRMRRYALAIADEPTTFLLAGEVLHVAAVQRGAPTDPHAVEFWAEEQDDDLDARTPRVIQVFGTGHELPPDAVWQGTCDRTADGLVWHLYELMGDDR